jgi:hypothetical protein
MSALMRGEKPTASLLLAFFYIKLVAATPTIAAAMSLSSSAQGNDSVIPRL